MQMLAFRTLGKRRLLSLTSLGETAVREQAAETPFFRSLLRDQLTMTRCILSTCAIRSRSAVSCK
jgi:hypothetical protein